MAELTSTTLIYALVGGFAPALFWLWFWLHEDRNHPEPKGLIALTFFSGLLAVPIAVGLEALSQSWFELGSGFSSRKILLWAAIEELVKYGVVAVGALRMKSFDEPIDAVIYMITAALGFAALENTLFLVSAIEGGEGIVNWFATGNARFLGAMVLHTVSSGLVGAGIGFAFYRARTIKIFALVIGLSTATILHAAFNFFIIREQGNGIEVFFGLWVIAIFAIAIFEKIRRLRRE